MEFTRSGQCFTVRLNTLGDDGNGCAVECNVSDIITSFSTTIIMIKWNRYQQLFFYRLSLPLYLSFLFTIVCSPHNFFLYLFLLPSTNMLCIFVLKIQTKNQRVSFPILYAVSVSLCAWDIWMFLHVSFSLLHLSFHLTTATMTMTTDGPTRM